LLEGMSPLARLSLIAALPMLLAACSSDPPANVDAGTADASAGGLVVVTTLGPVRGAVRDDVAHFYGIPFAAPPVGARRWRAPDPAVAWTATRDATRKGAACPQPEGFFLAGSDASEDCLFLNVWRPPAATTGRLPVMVFIHGGGFNSGTANDEQFDGTALALRGVVVVNFNYRLSQLGFLAHTALVAEDAAHHASGNYGLMDQQAALRWVRDNAAAFGGDPGNVTLFGESAGGISVCAHLTSPLSAGLFHRAISQSGPCSYTITPLRDEDARAPVQSAVSQGRLFAQALRCDAAPDVAACMRSRTVEEVLTAAPRLTELERFGARYQPIVDGYVLPEPPWTALRAGRFNRVPFITGSNQDEGTVFTTDLEIPDEAAFRDAVRRLVPDHVDEVLRLYPLSAFPSAHAAFTTFAGDAAFGCASRAQARLVAATGTPAYQYYFSRLNPGERALGLGVYHSSEIAYVFGRFTGLLVRAAPDAAVSDAMGSAWVRFATPGDPNAPGASTWPAFTAANDTYLEFGDTIRTATGLRRERCDALEAWIDPP
jgi:para-nitrobenzyl esterase